MDGVGFMSDPRFYNMIMKFAERYELELPVKCYECSADLIPNGIEDVEELCAVTMLCESCGAEPAVVGSKEDFSLFEMDDSFFADDEEDDDDSC